MIDQFSRGRFEEVLDSFGRPWRRFPPTSYDAEYRYYIQIKQGVGIQVRSSIYSDGYAAETGEDSIRCWLTADPEGHHPLSTNDVRWTTRVRGWERRLLRRLEFYWCIGEQLPVCLPCIKRGAIRHMVAQRARRGLNRGRWFCKCWTCGHWGGWLRLPGQNGELIPEVGPGIETLPTITNHDSRCREDGLHTEAPRPAGTPRPTMLPTSPSKPI